ncbi:unnamed protein product [Symbiodinium natans]|uniref:Uncharacterized protein n=1 Tax=Symbiodinium natans TaxID=878477 RepID=A0A812JXD0_9DINO|nr:unnamed protein product [Symbiodinium natans]
MVRAVKTDGQTLTVPRSRPTLNQIMVGIVLITMGVLIMYMYRVIDDLHREQQDLRGRLNQLSDNGSYGMPNLLVSQGSEKFLEARSGSSQGLNDIIEAARASNQERRYVKHKVEEVYPGHMAAFEVTADEEEKRRLAGFFTVGTTAGVGCYQLTNQLTETYDVSSATACNGNICPDCFITPGTVSQDITLTIQACSSAKWIRSASRSGVWQYTFINAHNTYTVSVTDNSGSATTYKVPPGTHVTAYCTASGVGSVTNKLSFTSTTLPTLSVDNGLTLSSGAFDASGSTGNFATSSGTVTLYGNTVINGAKTFATGSGTVDLNGQVQIADSQSVTVGSAGAGGAVTIYGNVIIGDTGTGNGRSLTVNGNFAQSDVTGATSTFATGSDTISLNGHVTVATGKHLTMTATGAGQFTTGTGAVNLNGATTVTGSNTFTSGLGAVSLKGAVTVDASTAFTVGTAGSGGTTTLYGDVIIGNSAGAASCTVNGNIVQADVGATATTITSGTGAINLNGDVTVASNKNLHMTATGSGSFQTGTGSVTFNGNTQVAGGSTFSTGGTDQVTFNGPVQIADSQPFSVGSAGNGGVVQLFGATTVGSTAVNGASSSLTVYGDVTFNNDQDGTLKTFATAGGQITLNGDVGVAAAKNFIMANTGTGQFQSGTGTVKLYGDTSVETGKTFTVVDYTNVINCNHAAADAGSTFCKASR